MRNKIKNIAGGSSETRIKIAIVDDHRLFRQGIIQILEQIDHFEPIFEAEDYLQLLTQMKMKTPDIILMDIQLNGIDGIDGIEGCKQIADKYPDVKIIALSMHTADHFIFHMMKAGARSYLPKDIDKESLEKAIDTVFLNGFYFTDPVAEVMLKSLRGGYDRKVPKFGESMLSKREIQVLTLICKGLTTAEISDQLFISIKTVEGHRKNLLEKTRMSNSVSLAVYAIKNGIINE
jgi:DNA-binding NarL/FixJ family response regulator